MINFFNVAVHVNISELQIMYLRTSKIERKLFCKVSDIYFQHSSNLIEGQSTIDFFVLESIFIQTSYYSCTLTHLILECFDFWSKKSRVQKSLF